MPFFCFAAGAFAVSRLTKRVHEHHPGPMQSAACSKYFGACERACQSVFNMLHITLYIFADSFIWGDGAVNRAEDQANMCALLTQP